VGRALVSVVTGSWQRHALLLEAIENIRQQTYRPLEHVVVSDGPDEALCDLIREQAYESVARFDDDDPRRVPLRFVELGFNTTGFLAASFGAVPFATAQWLARGDYQVWMADDERFEPDHIASLVDLLEERDADFVYSLCRVYHVESPHHVTIIGKDPPEYGQVTNVLYRRELLDYRGFRTHVGSGNDWDQVLHWVEVGARWAMLPRATMSHRADKWGEGTDYRPLRQPLRGQTSDRQRAL
jgi:glycosyltransferase involved in cell wall biosynthesis